MRLPGKKALVTGAASGIGKAVVNAFVHEGAEVTGADLEYCNAAPDSGEGPRLVGLDVTNQDDWEHLANELTSVDVVVACAGISHACHINESTLEDWRRIIDVNLTGAFLSVRYAARAMRQQKGGSIVLIGSASGVKASPGASAYCVSKAGLRMLVQVAALDSGHTPSASIVFPLREWSRLCGRRCHCGKIYWRSTGAKMRRGRP